MKKEILIVGEIKLEAKIKNIVDIVSMYNERIEMQVRTKSSHSKEDLDKAYHAVLQLYSYMKSNRTQYGILTSVTSTWIFFLDSLTSTNLLISPCFGSDQCIQAFIWTSLQANKSMNTKLLDEVDFYRTQTDEFSDHSSDNDHHDDNRDGDAHIKNNKRLKLTNHSQNIALSSSSSSVKRSSTSQLSELKSQIQFIEGDAVIDLPRTSSVCNGVWRVLFHSLSMYVKSVDISKNEESHERLRNEVQMYTVLKALQGHVIPRLLCEGWEFNVIFGILLEDVGVSLEEFGVENLFPAQKGEAVCALASIHRMGILHGGTY